jgi:succinoglycan biosynthesis protein ExoA
MTNSSLPPRVSVVIPCLDEEKTIGALLQALGGQTFPAHEMEVLVVDGRSSDGTRDVVEWIARSVPVPRVRLLDNPDRVIPRALNIGIDAARAPIVVRMDAHSIPDAHYVERSVSALERDKGDVVGGVWEAQTPDARPMARGIAAAVTSPVAAGNALYRFATRPASVDTVPFGTFRRDLARRIGGYDDSLHVNEDYEFNARVRAAGGTVWMDPAIRSRYTPRSSLRALARQYVRYGYWKAEMLTRHPGTMRLRQALPPVFTGSLTLLGAAAGRSRIARRLLAMQALPYAGILMAAGVDGAIRRRDPAVAIGMPMAAVTMHLSFGLGFISRLARGRRPSRTPA